MAVPNISFADLVPQYPPICRRREVHVVCEEDRFLVWKHDFHTSRNPHDTVVSVGNSTWVEGSHKGIYTGGSGSNSAVILGRRNIPHSQFTSEITIEDHGSHGTGYNDACTGFAVTTAIGNDVVQHSIFAAFRHTAGSQGVYLQYVHSGTAVFSSVVPFVPAAFPFKLRCTINHGSMGLWVVEGNIERLLVNLEIDYTHIDMEATDVCNRMRPLVYMQCDGANSTTISGWEVRPNGTIGTREHVFATYPDGRPITDYRGRIYMSCDETHVCNLDLATPIPTRVNGPYTRSWGATRMFNPVTGRMEECTARYVIDTGTRRYGLQEPKVVYDPIKNDFHLYASRWNEGFVTICHIVTKDNILHGYWVFDTFDTVTFDGLDPFDVNTYYDTDIRVINGRIYISLTVNNTAHSRSAAVFWGTDWIHFPNRMFVAPRTSEGGGFANIGNNLYVMTGTGGAGIDFLDYQTGNVVGTITAPVSGIFPLLARVVPFVRNGKTTYIMVVFSDESDGGSPDHGEDYVSASGVVQTNAFGATDAFSLGTFPGEQYSPMLNTTIDGPL